MNSLMGPVGSVRVPWPYIVLLASIGRIRPGAEASTIKRPRVAITYSG